MKSSHCVARDNKKAMELGDEDGCLRKKKKEEQKEGRWKKIKSLWEQRRSLCIIV